MSGTPTHVLACDGNECDERYVILDGAPPNLRDVRKRAADVGWAHRVEPRPGNQWAASLDFCPSCSAREAGGI